MVTGAGAGLARQRKARDPAGSSSSGCGGEPKLERRPEELVEEVGAGLRRCGLVVDGGVPAGDGRNILCDLHAAGERNSERKGGDSSRQGQSAAAVRRQLQG